MLDTLFAAVCKLAVEGAQAKLLPVPNGPKHQFLVQHPNGTLELEEAQPNPRQHVAGSLPTLIALARKFGLAQVGDPAVAAANGNVSVWYSRTGVVALLDDATRRDTVTYPLTLSPQLALLQSLDQKPLRMDQKQAIKFLRIDLEGCLARADGLLAIVRKLKWTAGKQSDAELEHARTSVSRSTQAEVSGASALPEGVSVEVPLFQGNCVGKKARVQLAIDVDPVAETFQFIPLPGQVEDAILMGEGWLGELLTAGLGEVPCYHGRPF
jgi:hypothetical protein